MSRCQSRAIHVHSIYPLLQIQYSCDMTTSHRLQPSNKEENKRCSWNVQEPKHCLSAKETSVTVEGAVITFASLSMKDHKLQIKPSQNNMTTSFPKLNCRLLEFLHEHPQYFGLSVWLDRHNLDCHLHCSDWQREKCPLLPTTSCAAAAASAAAQDTSTTLCSVSLPTPHLTFPLSSIREQDKQEVGIKRE